MVTACQIQSEVLEQMDTSDLVETVLNYPLLRDILAYNSFQEAYDAFSEFFNGLQALKERSDAAEK